MGWMQYRGVLWQVPRGSVRGWSGGGGMDSLAIQLPVSSRVERVASLRPRLRLPQVLHKSINRISSLARLAFAPQIVFPELLPVLRGSVGAQTCTVHWLDESRSGVHVCRDSNESILFFAPTFESRRRFRELHNDFTHAQQRENETVIALREHAAVVGFIELQRNAGLSHREQSILAHLAPALVPALRGRATETLTAPGDRAVMLVDAQGNILSRCAGAARLLSLAFMNRVTPCSNDPNGTLKHDLLCRSPLTRNETRWEIQNTCGKFEFHTRTLKSTGGDATTLLTLTHHIPTSLAVLRRCAALRLTPRQTDIAVRVIHGDSYETIATHLNISSHTAIDHVRALQTRLDVGNRAELITKLVAG